MSEEKRTDAAAKEQPKPKKKTKEQLLMEESAEAGARKVLQLQAQQRNINLYRAMERLLRRAPGGVRLLQDRPVEGHQRRPTSRNRRRGQDRGR